MCLNEKLHKRIYKTKKKQTGRDEKQNYTRYVLYKGGDITEKVTPSRICNYVYTI